MHVSLVLFPKCRLLAHALVGEVLMAANAAADRALFSWDSRSVTGAPVPSLEGPVIDVSAAGWQRDPCADLVLVLADRDPLASLPMGLRGFLGSAARSGATLGGAGGGVAVLAQLGFLNGHSAVLHAGLRTLAPDGWPLVATARGDHALDRRRLTATGGLALVDALLAWIAQVATPQLAVQTAQRLGHSGAQMPLERPLPARDPVLDRMQALMAARLDRPVPIETLCDALELSPKQLRTRCRKLLGRTPAQVYQDLRLQRAAHLLEHTALPVAEVAQAAGFASHSSFTRSYHARFGTQPRKDRDAAA